MSIDKVLKALGGTLIVVGAWTLIVPFIGPTFGYGMPPGTDQPAWEWNASHFQRHVIPGGAAIIAGGLMFFASRAALIGGSILGIAAGAWMVLGPFVVRAWLDTGGGGGAEASTAMQIITPVGYHHLPGLITLGISAFVLGWLVPTVRRELEHRFEPAAAPAAGSDGARRREPAERRARERERVGS